MARRVDKVARRSEILEAGERVLRTRGLASLQMREVAREAGVSAGTVYTYFATKDALFAALYARRMSTMTVELERGESLSRREMFVQFASLYREMYSVFGREVDLATAEMIEDADQIAVDQLTTATTRIVGVARSVMVRESVAEPDVALTVLWALLSGLAAHYVGPRSTFHSVSWERAVDFAAGVFIDSIIAGSSQQT